MCRKARSRSSTGSTFLYACRESIHPVCIRCFAGVAHGQLFKCTIKCRVHFISFLEYYPIGAKHTYGWCTEAINDRRNYHFRSRVCRSFGLHLQRYILVQCGRGWSICLLFLPHSFGFLDDSSLAGRSRFNIRRPLDYPDSLYHRTFHRSTSAQSALYSCYCIGVLLPKIPSNITQGSDRNDCAVRSSYCIDSLCLYTRNGWYGRMVRAILRQCIGISFPNRINHFSDFSPVFVDRSHLPIQKTHSTYRFMVPAHAHHRIYHLCGHIDSCQCQYTA